LVRTAGKRQHLPAAALHCNKTAAPLPPPREFHEGVAAAPHTLRKVCLAIG
jgi:hypothetical protein